MLAAGRLQYEDKEEEEEEDRNRKKKTEVNLVQCNEMQIEIT